VDERQEARAIAIRVVDHREHKTGRFERVIERAIERVIERAIEPSRRAAHRTTIAVRVG
jgi:hypothetical protein